MDACSRGCRAVPGSIFACDLCEVLFWDVLYNFEASTEQRILGKITDWSSRSDLAWFADSTASHSQYAILYNAMPQQPAPTTSPVRSSR